jgi:hypothetical protein
MPITATALTGTRPAGIIHHDFKVPDIVPGIDITKSILPAVFTNRDERIRMLGVDVMSGFNLYAFATENQCLHLSAFLPVFAA